MIQDKRLWPIFALILLINHIFILWTPLTHSPIMIDEKLILEPLKDINFFTDYVPLIKAGKIYDFQPVRDFTHFIDLSLDKFFGIEQMGVITNLAIFYLTIILLYKIFCFFFSTQLSFLLCSIFFSHPLFFLIYIEITQRKHILSFFFILLCYYSILTRKTQRIPIKSYIIYILSILSHPINALIPAWFFYQEKKSFKLNTLLQYAPFALLFIAVYVMNTYLYDLIHYGRAGYDAKDFPFVWGNILTAIGLHFRLFFLPYSYAVNYPIYTNINLIFTFIPVLVGWIAYKRGKFLFIFIPLGIIFATLYAHKSNVHTVLIQNTYVLTPSFIFLILLGILIKFKPVHLILPLVLQLITYPYAKIRTSQLTQYEYYFKQEPECRTLQWLVLQHISESNIQRFQELGYNWLERKCNLFGTRSIFAKPFINTHLIFESTDFSVEEKLSLFHQKYTSKQDQIILELATLIKYKKDPARIQKLYQSLQFDNQGSIFAFKGSLGKLIQDECESYGKKSCEYFKNYYIRNDDKNYSGSFRNNIPPKSGG